MPPLSAGICRNLRSKRRTCVYKYRGRRRIGRVAYEQARWAAAGCAAKKMLPRARPAGVSIGAVFSAHAIPSSYKVADDEGGAIGPESCR